jgi:hypothetical protein
MKSGKSQALLFERPDKRQLASHFLIDIAALDLDFSIRFLQYNELMPWK